MQNSKKLYHSKSPEEFKKYLTSKNKTGNKNKTLLIIFLDILLIILVLFITSQYLLKPKKSTQVDFTNFSTYITKKSSLHYFLLFQNKSLEPISISYPKFKPFLEIQNNETICFRKEISFKDFSLNINTKKAISIYLEKDEEHIKEKCSFRNSWFDFPQKKLNIIFRLDYKNRTNLLFEDAL